LSDAQTDLRFGRLFEKLREDRLTVAFVAEFSRGKSELINAIFFAGYGNRMLPSTVGRTTMCPTELLYREGKPPSIDLLPIRTRGTNTRISEYRNFPEEWTTLALDITSPEALQSALRAVSQTERVPADLAARLGFAVDNEDPAALRAEEDGLVEIPRWRHAVINFPHPLLKNGLVILDTPGLNAIGMEPELTLSLLPNAHAVLFILAADTGVTHSDLAVWNQNISVSGSAKRGRLVVLNKIDGLWDDLKPQWEIEDEIARQIHYCAQTLDLPENQIFPVSAKKGLIAKINDDSSLLERSRITDLERALSEKLTPAKQEIVRENVHAEFSDIFSSARGRYETRIASLQEQIDELQGLRGKNTSVVEYMMGKIRVEKEEFETGLQRYYAARSIFSKLTNKLFASLGTESLRTLISTTRVSMDHARFSNMLSLAMDNFFGGLRSNLSHSETEINEIQSMIEAVYKKFLVEYGLKLGTPKSFSLIRYKKTIDRLEAWCDSNINNRFKLMTSDKERVIRVFFEEIATQTRRSFERANLDAEMWLKSIMSPLENQVREHQMQIKRRLESLKRIHQATDTLEERINELEHVKSDLLAQINSLNRVGQEVLDAMNSPAPLAEDLFEAA
ncbi:MAG: dynamin family protein, partial [Candidatus Accumulibacter sp.]|nr:dynamin family protein [Accumulibacter sp.]